MMTLLDLTPRILANQVLQQMIELEKGGRVSRDQTIAALEDAVATLKKCRVRG